MGKKIEQAVTITTIARELGLSIASVSYVLNGSEKRNKISEPTALRITQTAERLGYIPNDLARSLRRKRSGVVGVIFGTLAHSWAERALIGMRSVFDAEEYLTFLTVSYWDPKVEEHEFNSLMQRRVEGIICVPTPDSRDIYLRAIRQGIPFVFLNDTLLDMPAASYIAWDAEQATEVALKHLIDCGYRRIGFLGTEHQTLMTRARYKAYVNTLQEAGLAVNPKWIAWEPITPSPLPYVMVEHMLQKAFFEATPRPEALFFTSDALALLALQKLADQGIRVPEDVAIIGMGDLEGTNFPGVGLSTVREPLEEMGREAARVILELIKNLKSGPYHQTVTGNDLKARRTTQVVNVSTPTSSAKLVKTKAATPRNNLIHD